MNRDQITTRLKEEIFDICVIGGGAAGLGTALDAALRGFKVALIEQDDFSSGTSSKSTKLIHGGVRYLEKAFKEFDLGHLKQVKHGLEERTILMRNAPHLTRSLVLVTPVFSWWQKVYYSLGLKLYDWLSKDSLPHSRTLNKEQLLNFIPTLYSKLKGGVMYYDGQFDDARYAVSLACTAQNHGAVIINHVKLVGFGKNNQEKIEKIQVKDILTNELYFIRSRYFINCAGVHADSVRYVANPELVKITKRSKGVHVVVPREVLHSKYGVLIPKTSDGRVVFMLPFQGKTLIGTTDDEYNGNINQEESVLASEVDYLLATVQPYLQRKIEKSEISAGFAGVRNLVFAKHKKNTQSLLRDHFVEHDKQSNLVSVVGGKWTTYRLMAKDAIDTICEIEQKKRPCKTDTCLLEGAKDYNFKEWVSLQKQLDCSENRAKYLVQTYGAAYAHVRFVDIVKENPSLIEDLIYPFGEYSKAEIIYAVRYEMAQTIRDFLARRIRLEILDWQACEQAIPIVAQVMAKELGWNDTRIEKEVNEYRQFLRKSNENSHFE